MKPEDRIQRTSRQASASGLSPDRPPLLLSQLGRGSAVRLGCRYCGWSRAYAPRTLIARLQAKGAGGPSTAIAHVARHVQWPCPMCHRMGWTTTAERGRA